jgi:hypothetical protein
VERGASAAEVREIATASGMRLMWRDGLAKARVGLTTIEEVNRIVAVQSTGAEAEVDDAASVSQAARKAA